VLPDGSELRRLSKGHSPQWSPDGSRLAFLDDAPFSSVFVQRAEGGDRRQLTFDNFALDLQWSPARDEIAFVAGRATGSPRMTYSLFVVVPGWDVDINVVDPSSGVLRAVTAGPDYDVEPSWSPDGDRISFQRLPTQPGNDQGSTVYLAKRDGTALRRLWSGAPSYLTGSAWAPGARIAVTGAYEDAIWLLAPDGSGVEEIPAGTAEWQDPEWSPGGDAVLVRTTNGSNIAAFTLDGRLLFNRKGTSATWSPDGRQVAFCSDGSLWRMDRDGSDVVRLAGGLVCDGFTDGISWSVPTGL
jgi:Tol biopolymer transport system component